MMTHISGNGGWPLSMTFDMVDISSFGGYLTRVPSGARRFYLNGLTVTASQANALMTGRPWFEPYLGDVLISIDSIEVTASEADAIAAGADPVSVLLPALWTRVLSEAELREGTR